MFFSFSRASFIRGQLLERETVFFRVLCGFGVGAGTDREVVAVVEDFRSDLRFAVGDRRSLKPGAAVERFRFNGLHGVGKRDGLEVFAAVERVFANDFRAFGERHGEEIFAVEKESFLNARHADGKLNMLETGTIREREGADLRHAGGEFHEFKAGTAAKRMGTDLRHPGREQHRLEVSGTRKSVRSDPRDVFRDGVLRLRSAVRELNEHFAVGSEEDTVAVHEICIFRRNADRRQFPAKRERPVTDSHDIFGQRHGSQVPAALKRGIADLRYALRKRHGHEALAPKKRTIADLRHAVRDRKILRAAEVSGDRDGIVRDLVRETLLFQRAFQFRAGSFPAYRLRLDRVFCQSAVWEVKLKNEKNNPKFFHVIPFITGVETPRDRAFFVEKPFRGGFCVLGNL